MLTGFLHVGVLLPESASVDEIWDTEGIVPADWEITTVSDFAGPLHLRQQSRSADQSRENKDDITANTTLNPSKRRGTG